MVSEHTNKMVVTIKYECIYFPELLEMFQEIPILRTK